MLQKRVDPLKYRFLAGTYKGKQAVGIELLTERFDGVVIQFGLANIGKVEKDGTAELKMDFFIIANPNNVEPSHLEKEDFKSLISDIYLDIIEAAIELSDKTKLDKLKIRKKPLKKKIVPNKKPIAKSKKK